MKPLFIAALLVSTLAMPVFAQTDNQNQTMQGQGMMMGHGMMNRQGMMTGQGMMNCPMMGMMGQPRTEGRVAFLKAELKITDAQESSWTAYADTLRNVHQGMANQMQEMMGPGMKGHGMMGQGMMMQGTERNPAPEALNNRIQMMETMLENLKMLQSATSALYETLDEDQKATADDLLGMPCGMGPM